MGPWRGAGASPGGEGGKGEDSGLCALDHIQKNANILRSACSTFEIRELQQTFELCEMLGILGLTLLETMVKHKLPTFKLKTSIFSI